MTKDAGSDTRKIYPAVTVAPNGNEGRVSNVAISFKTRSLVIAALTSLVADLSVEPEFLCSHEEFDAALDEARTLMLGLTKGSQE